MYLSPSSQHTLVCKVMWNSLGQLSVKGSVWLGVQTFLRIYGYERVGDALGGT